MWMNCKNSLSLEIPIWERSTITYLLVRKVSFKGMVSNIKIQKKEEKLVQDNEDYKRESELLAEYEEHFKSKLTQFEQELDDIS